LWKQHFELISEPSLLSAQTALLSEIQPEVSSLLTRVSTYLDKLERREQSLIAKYELQQGRLDSTTPVSASRPGSRGRAKSFSKVGAGGASSGAGNLSGLEVMKMKQLRQKKERLNFAIERLQLQAGQRERQLRKSMAVPQDLDF
jgi:DASH complex subunit SPC19